VSTTSAAALSAGIMPAAREPAPGSDPARRRRTARWMAAAIVVPALALAVYAVVSRAVPSRAAAQHPVVELARPSPPSPDPAPTPVAAPRSSARSIAAATRREPPPNKRVRPPASGSKPVRIEDDLKGPVWDRAGKR
jgi:hypothetical protein